MSAGPALPADPSAAWQAALWPSAELPRAQVRALVLAVSALHLGGAWALLQVPAVQEAVRSVAPMVVDLVAPPQPPQPAPPPPLAPTRVQQPVQPRPDPAPLLAAPQAEPGPAAAFTAPPSEPLPVPVVQAPPAPPAPVVAPAQPTPTPPPARRVLPSTAVQYLVEPPVEVPRLSRRAGESGVVWLRVVVDVRGLPALVQVKRSSGHARLDEQAVWAMKQARFKPQTEDGQPIELEVTAPIDYALE